MNTLDVIFALYLAYVLVQDDEGTLSRIATTCLLAGTCVGHDQYVLRMVLSCIGLVLVVCAMVEISREPSDGASVDAVPAPTPGPRMSAHELMGLAEDIAKADRLRASGDRLDHVRARELMEMAVDQAAAPRRGL